MKHPAESYLRDFASGCQDITMRLLVETHLHFCNECSDKVQSMRNRFIKGIEAEKSQSPDLDFDKIFNQLSEEIVDHPGIDVQNHFDSNILPDFLNAEIMDEKQWKWTSMWPSKGKIGTVLTDKSTGFSLHLGYFAPDVKTPGHKHNEDEITVMLKGGYSYNDKDVNVGDWDIAPKGTEHSPIIHPDEECWCLVRAKTSGAIDFTGISAWRKPIIMGMNMAEKYLS